MEAYVMIVSGGLILTVNLLGTITLAGMSRLLSTLNHNLKEKRYNGVLALTETQRHVEAYQSILRPCHGPLLLYLLNKLVLSRSHVPPLHYNAANGIHQDQKPRLSHSSDLYDWNPSPAPSYLDFSILSNGYSQITGSGPYSANSV
jgi:hypothetical protein